MKVMEVMGIVITVITIRVMFVVVIATIAVKFLLRTGSAVVIAVTIVVVSATRVSSSKVC